MRHASRNVFLLACCQALLFTNNVTLISLNGLAGYALAHDKALATLPVTGYVVGAAISTLPASLWMKKVGRRGGFYTGTVFGVAGAAIATLAIWLASFWLLVAGTLVLGTYNAFGQYYRYAAADVATLDWKARAISLVMAGGLVGGIIGPELSKHTVDLAQPRYLAAYASLIGFCVVTMGILSMLRFPPLKAEEGHGPTRPLREIVAQPAFFVAIAVAALGYGVMNLLMTSTPLAMGFCGHPYAAAASVISAHVVAMFGPSFFTGSLIHRFGVLRVMLVGVALMFACVAIGLSGQQVAHFWWSLAVLGVGWNFMYVGGTTLLTEAYRPAEKAKTQGAGEILIFCTTATSSFSSGVLVSASGWNTLNYVALPFLALAACAVLWLGRRRAAAAG
jgi:predicted MFS family arabinose efflux permease